jgi:hypothetical protein
MPGRQLRARYRAIFDLKTLGAVHAALRESARHAKR